MSKQSLSNIHICMNMYIAPSLVILFLFNDNLTKAKAVTEGAGHI